ncbi:MAG TPA: stage III sporulation protein AF [Candidatus Avidehalobacter gallistercoris]|uniref:Stage III sporulation protein AF n=1 Tax=Candidatus Avidehalobacter gallistercoris TaxID=2840694 RepID=A0A9D1HMN9_9FIRM|nr:stage III sporulation protein AF [Candidatus Avidehalobacter gallistercoris]
MALVDILTAVTRQALILSGLALFLEVMLPAGQVKKYARLVMGLLLAGALLAPLCDMRGGAVSASIFVAPPDNTEAIIAAGSNLSEQAEREAEQELVAEVEQQLTAFSELQEGVVKAEVNVELAEGNEMPGHNWGRVVILLSVADGENVQAQAIADSVKRSVAAFYDLDENAVQVSVASYAAGD